MVFPSVLCYVTGEINWPDDWSTEERVRCYVGSTIDPIDLEAISKACGISNQEARKITEELAEADDALVEVDDGVWEWSEDTLREQKRKWLAERPKRELQEELNDIEEEINEWRTEFDASSPKEVEDAEVAYDWRHNVVAREMIRDILDGE